MQASEAQQENNNAVVKDPTAGCTEDSRSKITYVLEEFPVLDSSSSSYSQELTCAVGSNITMASSDGQVNMTHYWCNFCSYKSQEIRGLLQHVSEHRFHCKNCPFQSFSRAAVIHHCVQAHEDFMTTAQTLKFCNYVPDTVKVAGSKKRKASVVSSANRSAKKKRLENSRELKMEVEEVEENRSGIVTKDKVVTPIVSEHNDKNQSRKDATEHVSPGAQPTPLPVITSVVSGELAVSAALDDGSTECSPSKRTSVPADETVAESSESQPPTNTQDSVSGSYSPFRKKASVPGGVSSGLCWNCGYCGFVTLGQAYLKIHLNNIHPGKSHKYVAMLVSSEEELAGIKQSDAQLATNPPAVNPKDAFVTKVGPDGEIIKTPSAPLINPMQKSSDEPISRPNRSQSNQDDDYLPVSFKCAHCNLSASQLDTVKIHLFQRHFGSVMYALDMKAVKLRQKRYVFFCLNSKCNYSTKEVKEFYSHIDKCASWLRTGDTSQVSPGLIKSYELTKNFIENTVKTVAYEGANPSVAYYGCTYCSYISANNTRLKKHVLSTHLDKKCVLKDLRANQKNLKMEVYFCKYCLFETRDNGELEIHINKHVGAENHSKSKHRCTDSTTASLQGENNGSYNTSVYESIVDKNDIEKALISYVKTQKRQRGRPPRKTAIKNQLNTAALPRLFRCTHCAHIAFGSKLMKEHILQKHDSKALQAVDVLKHSEKYFPDHVYFCPVETCDFSCTDPIDVSSHATEVHGLTENHPHLPKFSQASAKQVLKPNSTKPPASAAAVLNYECLYCSTSRKFPSKDDVKKHIADKHKGEEYIYRDCAARKRGQACRFYLCMETSCDFASEQQKDCLLHMLAHKNAKLYECTLCQWFSGNGEDFEQHRRDVHPGEIVTCTPMDLELDSNGEIVKKVAGQVIKIEK